MHEQETTTVAENVAPSAIYGHVTRYQHVERLGSEDVDGLLDFPPIVIQEKIDGASLSVGIDNEGLIICSRRKLIHANGNTFDRFNGAVDYVLGHGGISVFLKDNPGLILRGEWLVKHTINYDSDFWKKFYVYDIQKPGGGYVPVWEYEDELVANGILMVPLLKVVLAKEEIPTHKELIALADRKSDFGECAAEGVVVKRYDFVNRYFRTTWAKVVTSDFKEIFKINMGGTRKDPYEIIFANRAASDSVIAKVIAKIENEEGRRLIPEDMNRLIGTVWHDAVVEGIWDFTKKNKGAVLNFGLARKAVADRTRSYALAYIGGGI
jgi:hypothetical protein